MRALIACWRVALAIAQLLRHRGTLPSESLICCELVFFCVPTVYGHHVEGNNNDGNTNSERAVETRRKGTEDKTKSSFCLKADIYIKQRKDLFGV